MSKILTEWSVFRISPKEYLYALTIKSDKLMVTSPYDPKSKAAGLKLQAALQQQLPDTEVYFVGAANLEIAGQGDIDLLVVSPDRDFNRYIPPLQTMYGKPAKIRSLFAEWDFEFEGYSVELSLTYQNSSLAKQQLEVFNLLKNNKTTLRAYERFKLDSQGLSYREYIKRRMAFFSTVVGTKATFTLGDTFRQIIHDVMSIPLG